MVLELRTFTIRIISRISIPFTSAIFKVIEFVKETKRIILSHSRTFEEGNEPVVKTTHKRANGGRKSNNETAMINNVAASTSLGDIDALAKLKAQMEGKA